jgi:hypothetical protein
MRDVGGDDVLAGSIEGKTVLGKLITSVTGTGSPSPVFLDFSGVSVATGSWLREAVIAFRSYCLNSQLNLYPVIANPSPKVVEEMEVLLKLLNDAMVSCELDEGGKVISAQVLGPLEGKQQVTLEAVLVLREADAVTLAEKYKDEEKVGATGWNNRLAALAAKSILMEIKRGRVKFYVPVVEAL